MSSYEHRYNTCLFFYSISRFAGWDLRRSMSVLRYDGFVVCVEDAPILLDALKKAEADEERRLEARAF